MDPDFNFPYSATDLTEQINRIPNSYGLLRVMGLFSEEGVISTTVEIRMEDGLLVVLPATERGAPGTLAGRETGKTLFFKVPHFPHRDLIKPADIQNMLVMQGRMKRPATVADEVAKRLDPQSLAAAKQAVESFVPIPQPDDAVGVASPAGGWDGAAAQPAAKPLAATKALSKTTVARSVTARQAMARQAMARPAAQ